jgi:hypothetical protein
MNLFHTVVSVRQVAKLLSVEYVIQVMTPLAFIQQCTQHPLSRYVARLHYFSRFLAHEGSSIDPHRLPYYITTHTWFRGQSFESLTQSNLHGVSSAGIR